MRPWTRRECARLVEEAGEILQEEESPTTEAEPHLRRAGGRIFSRNEPRHGAEPKPASGVPLHARHWVFPASPSMTAIISVRPSSMISVALMPGGFQSGVGIFRLGELGTLRCIHARRVSTFARSPRLFPRRSQDLIAQIDLNPVQPARPVPTINQFRLLDTYALTKLGNWDFSFGKQSLWWGPDQGGSLLFSDNAEPIYMFRVARDIPFTLPGILQRLGPVKVDAFMGKLSGNQFPPRPLFHGEKISFKPTPNLERELFAHGGIWRRGPALDLGRDLQYLFRSQIIRLVPCVGQSGAA